MEITRLGMAVMVEAGGAEKIERIIKLTVVSVFESILNQRSRKASFNDQQNHIITNKVWIVPEANVGEIRNFSGVPSMRCV